MSAIVQAAEADSIMAYPEGTPYAENKSGTYWPNLNANSQKAFDAVVDWTKTEKVNLDELSLSALDHKLTILRYLRANNFDVKKTSAHILKNIEWRKKMDVDTIITKRPEEILGYSMADLAVVFPHWQYGFDKTGRPVVYKQYGKFDASKIKKMSGGNYDKVIEYHVWEQEAAGRLCKEQSLKLGRTIETTTGIVDVKDMTLFQITRDFLALTRAIADVDQGQYPETLGRIYVLNAPSVFGYVYAMVKPWLDPVVVSKIFVCKGPEEYVPILIEFIGKENLPSNYGGDLPPLNVDVHPYAYTLAMEYDGKGVGVSAGSATKPPTPSSPSDAADVPAEGDVGDVGADDLDTQLHRLEDIVAHTDFHGSDNTNHTASGKLLTPASSEKIVAVEDK